MRHIRLLLLSLLFVSCYYQEEDATLYEVGDNFELSVDSLKLQSNEPLHNQPIDTLCEHLTVYYGNPLVVAETAGLISTTSRKAWFRTTRFPDSFISLAFAI